MKILLVDDDLELGTMLSEYLTGEGFDATLVLTGKAGVEGALSGDYTAMILDIMLPDMSGIDVLRDVRKKSRLPIIMLTAKGDNIDRVIGLEMGADDYMPKPCYPRELVARLRAVLRRFEERPQEVDDEAAISFGELTLNPSTRSSEWRGKAFDLTASNSICWSCCCARRIAWCRRMNCPRRGWGDRARPMIAAWTCISAISARS